MSFFGRASNLVRGAFKLYTRPSASDADREAALEEELRRPPTPRGAPRTPVATKPAEAPPAAKGPERDEFGNVKRTL